MQTQHSQKLISEIIKKKIKEQILTTLPASCMQELESDMEQWTGSKLGKEYVKAVYSHPAYLTYMKSTPREMLGWMKLKLESRLLEEISVTSDMQMTPPLW